MNFCATVLRSQQQNPPIQTSARTEKRTRQDSLSRACPKTTSKVHVVGLGQRSVNTTNIGEENKSMFRSGEVCSRQETARLQQARRRRSTRPTRGKTNGRFQDCTAGEARKYRANKHQTTTRESAYSWALQKPTDGGTELKHLALNINKTSSLCPCLFVPHDILLTEQTEVKRTTRRSRHGRGHGDAPYQQANQNNKLLSNTQQRDMTQNYSTNTQHQNTTNSMCKLFSGLHSYKKKQNLGLVCSWGG